MFSNTSFPTSRVACTVRFCLLKIHFVWIEVTQLIFTFLFPLHTFNPKHHKTALRKGLFLVRRLTDGLNLNKWGQRGNHRQSLGNGQAAGSKSSESLNWLEEEPNKSTLVLSLIIRVHVCFCVQMCVFLTYFFFLLSEHAGYIHKCNTNFKRVIWNIFNSQEESWSSFCRIHIPYTTEENSPKKGHLFNLFHKLKTYFLILFH